MVKAVTLKPRSSRTKRPAEFTFRKCDPRLDLESHVCWRTEEMNVIGHHHVGANHAPIGFVPCFQQSLMHEGIRKILFSLPGTDCDENNRRLAKKHKNAFSWVT